MMFDEQTYDKAFAKSTTVVGVTTREAVHFALAETCAL
jgi:hypothetical protein